MLSKCYRHAIILIACSESTSVDTKSEKLKMRTCHQTVKQLTRNVLTAIPTWQPACASKAAQKANPRRAAADRHPDHKIHRLCDIEWPLFSAVPFAAIAALLQSGRIEPGRLHDGSLEEVSSPDTIQAVPNSRALNKKTKGVIL